MKLFRIIGALALLCAWAPAHGQVSNAVVVTACGTPPATYSAGANRQITQDTTGTLCTVAGGGGGGSTSISQATPGTTNGVNVNHSSYVLMTNGTSAGATNLLADTYSLSLPATFNGATIAVTFTSANGTTQTNTYTAQPATPPVFSVYAGTSAVASASGGTPTGNTILAGGPSVGSAGSSSFTNPAALSTGQLAGAAIPLPSAGGAQIQVANLNADTLTITQSLDGVNYVAATLLKQDLWQSATGVLTGSAANGIYSVMVFGGYLKITRTGSADTTLAVTYRGTN